jgi:hypothetical protein
MKDKRQYDNVPMCKCENEIQHLVTKPHDLSGGFFMCAMHGDKLDGGSPLWGYVIANH